MTISVNTQEAGTGKWFPVVIYTPGDDSQWARACELRDTLHDLGLIAVATSNSDAHYEDPRVPLSPDAETQ